MSPRVFSGAAVLALCLCADAVHAASPATEALLVHAAAQVQDAEYERALITLQDALSAPDNANEDLARIYWRMGEVFVFLNRDADAGSAFERVLHLSADFEPKGLVPPHVRNAFARTKERFLKDNRRIQLVVPRQSQPEPNRPLTFGVSLKNLPPGHTPRVFFRRALTEVWQSSELVPGVEGEDGFFTAVLPGFPGGSRVEFYVEVQDPSRRRVTGEGSALEPMSFAVPGVDPFAGPSTPTRVEEAPKSRWWIWAVVGGAVVASGVATYLALRPTPAQLDLRVTVTP